MDNIFNNQGKKISWVQIIFLLCIVMLSICAFQILLYESLLIHRFSIPLFIVGMLAIIVSAVKKHTLKGRMWLLADGAVTVALSVLLLTEKWSPVYFAVWEIALGAFKIAESLQLKRDLSEEIRGFFYIGIVEILSGIGFLARFSHSIKDAAIAIAITLAIQISAYALRYYLYPALTQE